MSHRNIKTKRLFDKSLTLSREFRYKNRKISERVNVSNHQNWRISPALAYFTAPVDGQDSVFAARRRRHNLPRLHRNFGPAIISVLRGTIRSLSIAAPSNGRPGVYVRSLGVYYALIHKHTPRAAQYMQKYQARSRRNLCAHEGPRWCDDVVLLLLVGRSPWDILCSALRHCFRPIYRSPCISIN
jgi:hypothetical protein